MIRTLLLATLPLFALSLRAADLPDSIKVGSYAVGCQAYTFKAFSVFEAIEKTAAAGGKTIEFFSKQKLSPEQPDVIFNHQSPPDVLDQVKAKLARHGITPMGYGVVKLTQDQAENRAIFQFAKTMGIGIVVTEPDAEALDPIEDLVKEFDIKIAIHNHPRRPLDRAYQYWDPNYVLSLVKDRDPRMGACADTGHWVRSGLDPVECIRILKGRIFDSHLKDLNEKGNPKAHNVVYGTGVSDIPAILNAFAAQGFHGPIHIEHEVNWETNLPEVTQCIDYIRAFKPAE